MLKKTVKLSQLEVKDEFYRDDVKCTLIYSDKAKWMYQIGCDTVTAIDDKDVEIEVSFAYWLGYYYPGPVGSSGYQIHRYYQDYYVDNEFLNQNRFINHLSRGFKQALKEKENKMTESYKEDYYAIGYTLASNNPTLTENDAKSWFNSNWPNQINHTKDDVGDYFRGFNDCLRELKSDHTVRIGQKTFENKEEALKFIKEIQSNLKAISRTMSKLFPKSNYHKDFNKLSQILYGATIEEREVDGFYKVMINDYECYGNKIGSTFHALVGSNKKVYPWDDVVRKYNPVKV